MRPELQLGDGDEQRGQEICMPQQGGQANYEFAGLAAEQLRTAIDHGGS
ncbi:MAG: hypothetical protein ABSC15_24025 [Terriglobales bacterium]